MHAPTILNQKFLKKLITRNINPVGNRYNKSKSIYILELTAEALRRPVFTRTLSTLLLFRRGDPRGLPFHVVFDVELTAARAVTTVIYKSILLILARYYRMKNKTVGATIGRPRIGNIVFLNQIGMIGQLGSAGVQCTPLRFNQQSLL